MHTNFESTPETQRKAARVQLMIFDVDGILTDGSLHFGPEGEMMKTFNVLDGQGIKLLQNAGIATAIISARQSAIVSKRAHDLGITHVMQGIHDKKSAFIELSKQLNIAHDACGFIGDDVIDLPILLRVGFAASVPNAHIEVRQRVDYITSASGGRGAAREVCDLILKAQGKYLAALAPFCDVSNT
ncbi:KdsC family phosphatase [Undibacterium fentianense]|uniref:3-deoxy-D-manno-octulosonate 8-phosphate phosphatase KdsC n=1 Tax=Undibacterium fentianense TaxID=2828728 RepID=A0A941II58_9BURK|nr:HAD family hydrolase [Undibacterium fentianense]MBR7801630.1 HAD family hydrolase [Undibacterium fentianense]